MKKNKKDNFPKGEIVIYKTKDGKAKLEVNLREETIWLDAHQIAKLFGVDRTGIVKHIQMYIKVENLIENQPVQKLHRLQKTARLGKWILII